MARRLRKSCCSSFPTSAMKGSNRRVQPDSIKPIIKSLKSMHERMHFSFEPAVASGGSCKRECGAISAATLEECRRAVVTVEITGMFRLCTAQKRQRWSTRKAMLSALRRYDLLT
jgi:hypothetical protein